MTWWIVGLCLSAVLTIPLIWFIVRQIKNKRIENREISVTPRGFNKYYRPFILYVCSLLLFADVLTFILCLAMVIVHA